MLKAVWKWESADEYKKYIQISLAHLELMEKPMKCKLPKGSFIQRRFWNRPTKQTYAPWEDFVTTRTAYYEKRELRLEFEQDSFAVWYVIDIPLSHGYNQIKVLAEELVWINEAI